VPIFIVIVGPLVLKEAEFAVAAGIDIEADGISLFFGCVLQLRSEGDDRAGAGVEGDLRQRSLGDDTAAARHIASRLEFVPAAGRQIEGARAGFVGSDRIDQQRRSKHILVADRTHARIAGKVHDQGAHESVILKSHLCGQGVDVGQEAVAQPVV